MDHGSFDRIARLFGTAGSRRAALGALLGTGMAGALGVAEATAAKTRKRRSGGKQGKRGGVSAQAVCAPPGVGVNRSNCDYTGADFSGDNISSSTYKNTIFRNAELVGTNLSSSNMRGANFRDANLCGANLTSSNLRQANFRDADLTLARLSSSACAGANFTAGTTWCGTRDCNGALRNDDCPGGPPEGACCSDADCGEGGACVNGTCVCVDRTCPDGQCAVDNETCCPEDPNLATCTGSADPNCYCVQTTEGTKQCHEGGQPCNQFGACTSSASCPDGTFCSAAPGICPGNCMRGCNVAAARSSASADASGERSPVR